GILQIEQDHQVRLYGDAVLGDENKRVSHTIHRGAGLIMNEYKIALATTGRVSRGKKYYPGIGTPVPLLLTSKIPSASLLQQYGCNTAQFYSVDSLARHVMALTQLHWGSTREIVRLPI